MKAALCLGAPSLVGYLGTGSPAPAGLPHMRTATGFALACSGAGRQPLGDTPNGVAVRSHSHTPADTRLEKVRSQQWSLESVLFRVSQGRESGVVGPPMLLSQTQEGSAHSTLTLCFAFFPPESLTCRIHC